MKKKTIKQKILKTARNRSVFRAADVLEGGDPRSTLCRMVKKKELIRVSRGVYSMPDAVISPNHSLVSTTKRYPGGVICLMSALVFHGVGTQMPYVTWMMRSDRKKSPSEEFIQFVYSTGPSFSYGVEKHLVEGTEVFVYSVAKTVVDCFKYRNKIGLDVGIEALRESWLEKRASMDELWGAARICRVERIMQPYLEMLVQ